MDKTWRKLLSVLLSAAVLTALWGPALPGEVSAASSDERTALLAGNAEWRYFDQGQDLQSVWQDTYDDSEWSVGNAPLGFKDNGSGIATDEFGPLQTTVSYGDDKSAKHRTTYFRSHLEVNKEEIDGYGQLLGTFAIDDGALVYVNGTEIARFGMPAGEIEYSTKADSSQDLPVLYEDVDLTAALKETLRDGDNVIAVEVHQQSDSSSDLYFDMRLDALADAPAIEVSKVTVTFNGDPTSAKGFAWYTPLSSENSEVQVVENKGGAADFSEALTFEGESEVSTISPSERSHKAEATGLRADTSYFFRVGDPVLDVWSETGTFHTAPEDGAFTFINLTDTQAQDEEEAMLSAETLAKAIETVPNAEFVVHNGDVVEHSTTEQEWGWLLDYSKESLLNTTIVPASGNHDNKSSAFYQHFNLDNPEGSATTTGAYYSYDYSNAHFIVLNSNENSAEFRNFSAEQVEWLKNDVAAAKEAGAEWIIVSIHKGPYTTANHATDSDIIDDNGERSTIAPLMNELGIDLVLQGHDHIYARTKPILSDGTAETAEKITETLNGETIEYAVKPDGTIYLIPGTAGAKVYFKNTSSRLGEPYFSLFERAEENHARKYGDTTSEARGQVQNFVGITVDGGKLTAVTYEIDQNVDDAEPFIIDQFGIVKETEPDYSQEKVSKVTVTFNGDPTSAKGFTWYTSSLLTGSDLQVVEHTEATPDFTAAQSFEGHAAASTNSPDELVHKAVAEGLSRILRMISGSETRNAEYGARPEPSRRHRRTAPSPLSILPIRKRKAKTRRCCRPKRCRKRWKPYRTRISSFITGTLSIKA